MSDLVPDTTHQARSARTRRSDRPERMMIGGEEMVRNDVVAREKGETERTTNRGDALGAPYMYIAGVKYRPIKRYHQFLLGQIQVRNQRRPRSIKTR